MDTDRENPTFSTKIIEYFRNLNLFPSTPPSTNNRELRNQILSTRIFLIIFILLSTTFILYNSLRTITKTETVEKPDREKYLQLYSKHSQTLTCDCTTISINYKKFLSIDYNFHEICSSDFITDDWIYYLLGLYSNEPLYSDDFRVTSPRSFSLLKKFCQLMNKTINDSLTRFYVTEYVTKSVISEELFITQVESLINQFISSTTNIFLLSFQMIRDTTHVNGLYSAYDTNYYLSLVSETLEVTTTPRQYSNCNCKSSSKCISQSAISNASAHLTLFTVPGFYTGCYLIESLLQSNLECFYDQICIELFQSYITSKSSINVTALNRTLYINETKLTIEELLNRLMVDKWERKIMYEKYYEECQPSKCIYLYEGKNDIIYMITSAFGFVTGLATILQLIIPRLIKFIRRNNTAGVAGNVPTVRERFRHTFIQTKNYLTALNLFPSATTSTNNRELRNQILSTRIFLIIFILLSTTFILYNSLRTITKTETVEKPNREKYLQLYSKHSQTLTCDCTTISINYKKFLSIDYSFHEICSSDFITDDWIYYLLNLNSAEVLYTNDFRLSGPLMFQSLRTFCELMNKTINDSLTRFYATEYVTKSVISEELFISQVESIINQFISSTTNTFLLSFQMIRETTKGNHLYSALQTNYDLRLDPTNSHVIMHPYDYINCNCAFTITCIGGSTIYNASAGLALFTVPGFYTGCYLIEALLQSNLECFYYQICIELFQSYITSESSINVTALNRTLYINETTLPIKELLNRLMVDKWERNVTYEKYYEECQPSKCIYTYEGKNDIIYIIITVFGFLGNLVTILKLVIPPLVKLARRDHNQQRRENGICQRFRQFMRKIIEYFRNLNLFPSTPPSTNDRELKNQILSTRIFLIIFILLSTTFILYNSLRTITKTETIQTPNREKYLQLYSKHSQTLTCDCTTISINYKKFLSIDYNFHEVCSSDFITDDWIYYLLGLYPIESVYMYDFRRTSPPSFQLLRSFCELMNKTINDSLTRFYATEYVTKSVISEELFITQVESLINQFISSTTNIFLLSFQMIRDTTDGNALLSALKTNYGLYIFPEATLAFSYPFQYSNCSCAFSSRCITHSAIFNASTSLALYIVPGFYFGCQTVESLLQSNLECFYDQRCLDRLQSYITSKSPMNITVLNRTLYMNDTKLTIEELLNRLMVDKWERNVMYEKYYKECQPSKCIYTYEGKNDIIYMITSGFEFMAGLATVLGIIIPKSVTIIIRCIQRRRRRIVPQGEIG